MQKLQGAAHESSPQPERMPRAPARPHAAPAPRVAAAPAFEPEPSGHPVYAHHDRVATAHAEFLKTQERVHLEFLAHRNRLLELLRDTGVPLPEAPYVELPAPPLAPAPALESAPAPAHTPAPTPAPRHGNLATTATTVKWEDVLLDSHVLPYGALFAPLGRVLGAASAFAGAECELQACPGLPGPGEVVTTEVDSDPAGGSFQLVARVGDAPRLVVSGVRGPVAAFPGRGPAPGAPATARSPRTWTAKRQFSDRDLATIYEGNIWPCFGDGFERSAPHTRTPPLPGAKLVRLTSVSSLDPQGGPWAMGAMRAQAVPTIGDFVPPAPAGGDTGLRLGRLYQGAQQLLAFFVMAAGGTIARDGWRFEAEGAGRVRFLGAPALDAPLEYELVVESLGGAPWCTLVGDVRAWSGDKLVFAAERISLRLVADFPLTSDRALQADGAADAASGKHAADIDGFRLDYASMVAGALGRPTDAFNQAGAFFETGERQMPRLPGPPYHFVTRVTKVEGERLSMKPGAKATMEYDVPEDAWYFDENGNRSMPWPVLLEVALQPCGWLSVYVGCPLMANENVFFRNLDGAGKMTGEVLGGCTIRTDTRVTSVASVAGMMLVSYKIECYVGDREVCNLTAAFGYFPNAALDSQPGLPTTDEQRAALVAPCELQVDLAERPEKYCAGPLRMPGPMLLMIDRVTGFWKDGGAAGKGKLRVEKTVKPTEWYFRAHFYSDPVQPGSLGVEQMLQTLQFFVIEEDLAKHLDQPYFEPLALNHHVSWRFRGQVRPENKRMISELEIVKVETTDDSVTVIANGSLWVNGVRCYEAKAIGIRARSRRPAPALPPRVVDSVIDPAVDAWVSDHRPSYTVPVMPMMSMVDRLAQAALDHVRAVYPPVKGAPGWVVTGGSELRAMGWLICDRPKKLRTEVRHVFSRAVHRTEEAEVIASLFDMSEGAGKRVAMGRIRLARKYPEPPAAWAPLEDGAPAPNPYTSGSIFWGPKLQVLRRLSFSKRGLSADLDAAGADAPIGVVHHILLDGALHGIPHDELEKWSDKISPGHMGVPVRLTARFFGPPPAKGIVRAEVRFAGFDGANAFPTYLIQMIDPSGRVWATLRHVEMLIPFGHRGMSKADRVPFLVERKYQKGSGLSDFHADRTELRATELKRMDGLPGSVAHVYRLERDAPVDARVVAIKDHVGQRAHAHPGAVQVDVAALEAWTDADPTRRYRVVVEQNGNDVVVRDAPAA